MVKIFFEREQRMVEIPPGETLLHAARKAGVEVHRKVERGHRCYDAVVCPDCRVMVKLGAAALSERTALEAKLPQGARLACQARAYADVVLVTPSGPRFLPDTAPPTWGIFSGAESGLAAAEAPRLLPG